MSYESSPRRERRSGSSASLLIGMLAGVLLSNVARSVLTESPADQVSAVQDTRDRLYDQLVGARTVDHLRVYPEHHTFTFATQSATNIPEICSGSYEERHKAAQVVGDLTCSQTVAVAPTS